MKSTITRRAMVGMAGLAAPAFAGARALVKDGDRFSVESDRVDVRHFEKYHQGIGTIGARFFQFTWKTSNSLDDCVAFEPRPTPSQRRPFDRWSSVAACFAA